MKIKRISIPIFTFLVNIYALFILNKVDNIIDNYQLPRDTIVEIKVVKDTTKVYKYYCIGTYYNACESQCDESYQKTASNDSIDTVLLNEHRLRWIALSRDLLKIFNYDDTVIVESENSRINGEWIVKDAMNSRWRRRVDFLVPMNDTFNIGKCNIAIYEKQSTKTESR